MSIKRRTNLCTILFDFLRASNRIDPLSLARHWHILCSGRSLDDAQAMVDTMKWGDCSTGQMCASIFCNLRVAFRYLLPVFGCNCCIGSIAIR